MTHFQETEDRVILYNEGFYYESPVFLWEERLFASHGRGFIALHGYDMTSKKGIIIAALYGETVYSVDALGNTESLIS